MLDTRGERQGHRQCSGSSESMTSFSVLSLVTSYREPEIHHGWENVHLGNQYMLQNQVPYPLEQVVNHQSALAMTEVCTSFNKLNVCAWFMLCRAL